MHSDSSGNFRFADGRNAWCQQVVSVVEAITVGILATIIVQTVVATYQKNNPGYVLPPSGFASSSGSSAAAGGAMPPEGPEDPNDKNRDNINSIKIPKDGTTLSTEDALNAAHEFLGDGYKDMGNRRYVSRDGLRQVRLGDSDILGQHGGGPHINLEILEENLARPGKMKISQNIHIYLKE